MGVCYSFELFLPQEKVEEERQGINDLRAENLQGGVLTQTTYLYLLLTI